MSTNDWQQRWQQTAKAEGTVPVTTPEPTPQEPAQPQPHTLDSFDLLTARRLAFLLWRMAREESGIDGYQVRDEDETAEGQAE